MDEEYRNNGVSFRYPGHWDLTEDRTDEEVFVTVSSPETSFWTLTLFFDRPEPNRVLESAISEYRSEYDDVDLYPTEAKFGDCQGQGYDLEFFCYELTNSVFLRACRTGRFTALVLSQGTDVELEETRYLLDGITDSLVFEPSGDPDDA